MSDAKGDVFMPNKKWRPLKWMSSCLYGHFVLWTHSLRTICASIFILLMTYMLAMSTGNSVDMRQIDVHMGETLFSYANNGFNLIMTSIALMVMMSDLPRCVSYQNYAIIRLSRTKWLLSLIVFGVGTVLVFTLLMLGFSAMFSLPFVTPGSGWSDLERLAENTDYINEVHYISNYIKVLQPMEACILAVVILMLFWITMEFVLLLFSLHGVSSVGVVFCVSLLLLNITILFESLPGVKLPGHFATLGAIASQVEERKLQHVVKVIVGYLLLDALLLALLMVRAKKMEIRFASKE